MSQDTEKSYHVEEEGTDEQIWACNICEYKHKKEGIIKSHITRQHVKKPNQNAPDIQVVAETEEEALAIANATEYGLGAGVWTRDSNRAFRMGRGIKAGRVWMNCYHAYPAHAAFGGYKKSGIGRETHKMALEHYQQTKNMLVSYDINPMGFF